MEARYVHIEGALKGRLDAQRALYEALAPRVLYTCRRYFTQEAEAEDAMIRTMTTTFQQLPTIREAKALPAWLRQNLNKPFNEAVLPANLSSDSQPNFYNASLFATVRFF